MSISNFWKLPGHVSPPKVEKKTGGGCYGLYELCIEDARLKPPWVRDGNILLPARVNSKGQGTAEVSLKERKGQVPLYSSEEGKWFLDPDRLVNSVIYEDYFPKKTPLLAKLPFPYFIVPGWVKNRLYFLLHLMHRRRKKKSFPQWPIDKSVDYLRWLYMKSIALKSCGKIPYIHFWPGGSEMAVTVTHDVETADGIKNIELFREIERKYDIKSSWSVVSHKYNPNIGKLKELKKEGCEIISHAYNHDGKLAFLGEKAMRERITCSTQRLKELDVKGFRAPMLQRNKRFFEVLQDYFSYDSSVPDTETAPLVRSTSGCSTVFPFFIGKMVELPLTVPQDQTLIHGMHLSNAEMFEVWKQKISWIRRLNGIAVIDVHPDTYISGNMDKLRVYEKLLKHVSSVKGAFNETPSAIADWWRSRDMSSIKKKGKEYKIIGDSRAKIAYFR